MTQTDMAPPRQLDTGTVVAVDTEVLGDQLAPAVSLPPAVNLSTNPSFETGVTGWGIQNGSNAPVQSATRAFVGTQSMLVARGAGTSTLWATRSIGTQVDASKSYVMSAYLWVPAANPTNGGIRVSGTDVAVPASATTVRTTTRDAWARVEFPFTTNAVGNTVNFLIDGGTSGQIWVDAVMLHEGSTALPYGDGDQPGWAWDGTPHASTSRTTTTPAAPAGSTTLLLEDVVDFDADGGTLNIGGDLDEHGVLSGGQTLDYESCDDDTSTIVLSAPLAATWDETTPVRPYPLVMEKTAQVMIGNSGEAVPVRVRQRDWPLVRDGIRTGGHGEVVDVELIDDAYVLVDTPGTPPLIDGSYLDPGIPLDPAIVPAPAPAAPTMTPVPTLTGSVGALFLRMPPVANPTGTVIDVWVGTTASIPLDATTYHGEATGTTYVIEKMPNGTAIRDMPATTVYRVVIRPRNITGNGTASAEITGTTRPVDAADFAVGYLYAGEIDVTQLTGGTFNLSEGEVSVIEAVNAATGAKVGMSGTDGFYVLGAPEVAGQQGPTLVDFPIDGKPNIISGVLQATSLTTTNDATFNGTTTVAPGGTLVLGGQVQAPKAAPSAVASYDIVQHVGYATAAKWTYAGLTLGHDGNYRTVRYDNTGPYTTVVESYHPTTGALVSSTTLSGFDARGGIVYSSAFTGRYYMLGAVEGGVGWRVRAYDTALALVWESGAVLANTVPDYVPVLGWDHVTAGGRLLVASIANFSGVAPGIDTYNPTSGALGTATTWTAPGGYSYVYDLAYVARVTTEYGDRYIFRRSGTGTGDGVKNFQVFTTASAHQTNEEWPAANTATVQGAWYDGTRFRSLDTTGKRFRYEYGDARHMWDSGSAVREVSYSWYDSAGTTHETTPSPKASVTMPKRARLSVTVNSIPTGAGGADDPNAARIYVGRGTGVANGSMNLEKTIAAPGTAWSTDATVAQESPTTHPPTVNGFPPATASSLTTSGGVVIRSDGSGDVGTAGFRDSVRTAVIGDYAAGWTAYTPTFTAVTTNPTTANFTRTGRYTQRGKQVTFTIVITCNAASGFGSGNYSFGLPVTARNLNEVVVTGAQTGPIHSYVGRSNDATTVNLILTSTDAAMSDTTSGMANGTVLRINGTYEAA